MNVDVDAVALVTGAAGFAGRHLVEHLESTTSWEIVGLARSPTSVGTRARSVSCDLRDRNLTHRVLERYRPDVIFHLAAQSYVPKAVADPASTLMNNILGQVNIFESALSIGIQPRILVVSSSEIYGAVTEADLPVDEDAPLRPANPYAVSKVAQDLLAYQFAESAGMDIVRVRPFNHTGPGQSDRFVVSGFARQIAQAEMGRVEPSILVGNLEAERDFLDVRDVASAYLLAIQHGETGGVYNLSSGIPRRIGDLLDTLISYSSVCLSVRPDPARMRPADVKTVYGDSSRLRDATGWRPQVAMEQTLFDTLEYWRATL